ncbi:MAG: hypothetical protein AAF226_16735, partial [Verrucomicrobiota bacterium]
MAAPDHKVREISVACPRLRRDVRTHYQEYQGKASYIIEDTSRGKFYQVGFPEHQYIQCLDGRTTIAQALARNAATQGENALTEKQGDQLVRWLIDNDLLETDSSNQSERRRDLFSQKKDKAPKKLLQKMMFFRIPLGCPDRFLGGLTPLLGWIFSVPGLILWMAFIAYTALKLGPDWERFISSSTNIVAPGNWLRMVIVYGLLKILHEVGHGVACKK